MELNFSQWKAATLPGENEMGIGGQKKERETVWRIDIDVDFSGNIIWWKTEIKIHTSQYKNRILVEHFRLKS